MRTRHIGGRLRPTDPLEINQARMRAANVSQNVRRELSSNAGYRSPILALLNRAPARSGSTTIIGLQHRFPSGRLRRALSRWWPIAYVPNLSGWVGGRSDVRRYRAIASKEAGSGMKCERPLGILAGLFTRTSWWSSA